MQSNGLGKDSLHGVLSVRGSALALANQIKTGGIYWAELPKNASSVLSNG